MNVALSVPSEAARAAPGQPTHVMSSSFTEYTETIKGEPLSYPSSPNPVVSTNELTIPPGTVTPWMTHPVQAFLFVLEGVLTVEFAEDGSRHTCEAGQGFLQTRTHWHRGRNDGDAPARFVAVFIGAKGVTQVVHPPAGKLVDK